MDIDQDTSLQVNVGNCSIKIRWVHVSGKTTLSMDLELNFTLKNIHFKSCEKCTYILNSMCASLPTLSPIYTQECSQAVNGPISILKSITVYSLNYLATSNAEVDKYIIIEF